MGSHEEAGEETQARFGLKETMCRSKRFLRSTETNLQFQAEEQSICGG